MFNKSSSYYDVNRSDLVDLLPSINGSYLEIGCGSGSTLEYIKSKGASYVAGIDINKDAITTAKNRGLDFAEVVNIEEAELPFSKEFFDCIICADVIEHLYNPWNILKNLALYLKQGGYVLLSIPNIKHYTILKDLILNDDWRYTELGILDSSHIRFFTFKEINKLINYANLRIITVHSVKAESNKFKFINTLMLNRLNSFSTVQYYILATK